MPEKVSEPSTLKSQSFDKTQDKPVEVLASKELKTLLTWKAPCRPFKKRDREFWTTVLTIIFLISLILLFVKEWFLIATIFSLTFVYYVLSTVPPEEVEYSLTNRGVRFIENEYPWENFYRFWISKKYDQQLLHLEGQAGFSGRLVLMLGGQDEGKVKAVVGKYLLYEKAPPTFFDKSSDWLSKKIPISTS